MKIIKVVLKWTGRILRAGLILAICSGILFVAYKCSQPMQVAEAPQGMTYFEFMADRLDAAKTIQPARCGWGMFLSLALLGPLYSIVYTEAGIHPDGLIGRGTATDPDVPKNVAGAKWYQVPGIWWETVEHLSWTMLGKPAKLGCRFRAVEAKK